MDKKAADIDWGTVAKYIAGSLAVGGGVAAGSNLVKQLRWLKDRNNRFNDTSVDDDTLYINLPVLKKPPQPGLKTAANNSDTVGAALISSVLAALLGYRGVNSVYNGVRKNQLQKELDKSQIAHVNLLQGDMPQMKSASGIPLISDTIGAGKGLAALSLIASAILSNAVLSNHFRDAKPKNPNSLSRVKFRAAPMEKEVDTVGTMPSEKEAFISDDALEIFIRTGLTYADKKASDLRNLVNAVVYDGVDTVKKDFLKCGSYDMTMDKYDEELWEAKSSKAEKYAAVVSIVKDPILSEFAKYAAAHEHAAATTNTYLKLAAQFEDPELREHLVSIYDSYATLQKYASMKPFTDELVKRGFIDPALLLPLGKMLAPAEPEKEMTPTSEKEEPAENILYDTTVSPSDTENKIDNAEMLADEDFIDQFITDNKDTILDIIQTQKTNPQQ